MERTNEQIIGCDIGARYIILHDGKKAIRIEKPQQITQPQLQLQPGTKIIIEQTGAYGIRWAEIFTNLGYTVYIADGRDFKNYRLAHSRKKDDTIDAYYLRKYYIDKKHKCREYNKQQTNIRALIRQHIRNQKDITKHTNRLRQYIAMIYPHEELHIEGIKKLHNNLKKLKNKLQQTPHALTELALTELKKLEICIEEANKIEQEIKSIAQNHPDYEILKTFPIGDIQIATLLAYSWDIKNFPNKDTYIAYTLMGTNIEQSGTSIYKIKTDKARTEIKGIFYMLFMQAHRKKHILKPLAEYTKQLINTKHNYKKRYIKFISRFLELTYKARKERTDYITTLQNKQKETQQEIQNTQKKQLTQTRAYKIYKLKQKEELYKQLIQKAQRKDISEPNPENPEKAEHQVYMGLNQKQEKKEKETKNGKTNNNNNNSNSNTNNNTTNNSNNNTNNKSTTTNTTNTTNKQQKQQRRRNTTNN